MKIKEIMDKDMLGTYQKKLLRAGGICSIFFLICFLISRGIYSAGLPQIGVTYGSNMKLGHKVEVEGKVVANQEIAVAAEPGLLISSLLVGAGQQVEQGTELLRIDMEHLGKKIEEQQMEIKKKELQIQTIKENEGIAASQKETDKKRADEDYANAREKANSSIGQAQSNLEQAQSALGSLESKEAYISRLKEENQELLALKENLEGLEKEALQEAEAAMKNYEEQLEQTLGSEWESQKDLLSQAVTDSENARKTAQEEGESNLNAAARGIEDARARAAADSSLAVAEMELEELKEQLRHYMELKESGGVIYSDQEGDIIRTQAAAGDLTGETAILIMTDKAKGYRFLAEITKEEKKYVEIMDVATVQLRDGTTIDMTIDAVEEDTESGQYRISGRIEQNVKLNDSGILTIQKANDQNLFCVPLQAVHGDGSKYYVLVAESRQTIMGEQLCAIKYPIEIKDQNDLYAAIGGSVSGEQPIITTSTKIVYEGDTVRLLEP